MAVKPYANDLYIESLRYITAVVDMLNKSNLDPDNKTKMYLKISLVDEDCVEYGTFSDEIASDCWSYVPTVVGV